MAPTSKPNLTPNERNKIAQFLFQNSEDGQLNRGMVKRAAAKYGVNRRTIQTLWQQAKMQVSQSLPIHLTSKKVGTKRSTKLDLDGGKLKLADLSDRGTVRGVAAALNVSPSTACRWIKAGLIRTHSNAIKPELTDKCKLSRLKFSLSALEHDRKTNVWKFNCMRNVVHIDEKWFMLTKTTQKYYLHPEEGDPYRACKSKKHITKVMFLCAVARPIYNSDGTLVFDGKIGIFPFTHQVAAKRNSKRRERGTLETKAVDSITKDVIKQCLITEVIPAIKRKWPLFESTNIWIQQDNARPHISDEDIDFRKAASSDGFNIHLFCQPTNSPDLNVNDLGWFRALQALQTKRASYNIDQLLEAVDFSFTNLSDVKLNKVFLSLQNCMIEIMKVKGHNNYKLPHMHKDKLIRLDALPDTLEVEEDLVKECVQHLVDIGEAHDFGRMIQELNQSVS